MIKISEKHLCCGCGACEQICPKNCISMEEDSEGFFYPKVLNTECIECKLCEKACPILNPRTEEDRSVRAFIAFSKDEKTRLRSSSGGIFSILANMILEEGGVVFGASFDDECIIVQHISVENTENLNKLRGSKYLQSRIENSYKEAETYLKAGRKVLFSGTACQIAGLKGYLRKDYPNLLTVDFICHGVPSPKVWKLYIENLKKEYGSDVRQALFRYKNNSWNNFSLLLKFYNDKEYECIFNKDPYMRMFLLNIDLRPSCYDCHFKGFPRLSDITLGDCWGVEKHSLEMDDDKGTSVVIINSEKGEQVFNKVKDNIIFKQISPDVVFKDNTAAISSVSPHPYRKEFFVKLNRKGINAAYKMLNPSSIDRIKHKLRIKLVRFIKK